MKHYRMVEFTERIYGALLWLYPRQFRRRFGTEMKRVFSECCYDELQGGKAAKSVEFVLHTLKDLVLSAGAERIRELNINISFNNPVFEIIDSTLMPTIIVGNLIALGSVVTLLFF